MPMPALIIHRTLGVEHQILLVVHVDIVRFAVGQQQDQLVGRSPIAQKMSSVPQRRAHACGQLSLHACESRPCILAVGFVELLEAVVLDIVTPVRVEAVNGELVAELVHGVRYEHAGLFARDSARWTARSGPSRWSTVTDPATAARRDRGCCARDADARADRAPGRSACPRVAPMQASMSSRSPSSCFFWRCGRWICTALIRLVRRFTVSSFRRRISSMARGSPLGAGFSSSVHQAGRSMPIT